MCRPLGVTLAVVAGLGTGCLYTGTIEPPPTEDQAPYFFNWRPSETSVVTIDEKGMAFEVYYSDDDPDDVNALTLEWQLDTLTQGNGNKIYVWPQDLGQDSRGVLVAIVTDPAGKRDTLVWNLEAAAPNTQGE